MSIKNHKKNEKFSRINGEYGEMQDREKDVLTLGNFAKLANISRDTLSFYYKKGLVEPAYIGENGYKYFLPEQVQTINYIKYLRKCDMPLKTIKDVLQNPSYDMITGAFHAQQDALSMRIEQLKQATAFLGRLKKLLDYIETKEMDKPYTEYFDEEKMYLTPVRFCHSLNHYTNAQLISDFLDFESDTFPTHLMCCTIPSEILERDDFCSYMHNSLECADEKVESKLLTRPAGTYACLVHEGNSGTIRSTIHLLLDYIKKIGREKTSGAYIINSAGYINLTNSNISKYLVLIRV